MEKRLPIALFLCFAVLFAWSVMNPPPKKPAAPQDVASSATVGAEDGSTTNATGASAAPGGVSSTPAEPEPEPVEETVEFGRRGEVGHYLARFTTRGAALLELATGTYLVPRQPDAAAREEGFWSDRGFDEEQRADPANWVRYLTSVDTRDGPTGSLVIEAGPSARDVAPRSLARAVWRHEVERDAAGQPTAIVFRHATDAGIELEKRIAPIPGSWQLEVALTMRRTPNAPEALRGGQRLFLLRPAGVMPAELRDKFYPEPRAVAVGPATSDDPKLAAAIAKPDARDLQGPLQAPAPLALVGAHNKYFAVLFGGADVDAVASLTGASYRRVADRSAEGAAALALDYVEPEAQLALFVPDAPGERTWRYTLYAGPKDHETFHDASPANAAIVDADLSWFSTIGNVLLDVLALFQRLTGNWGVAIILLTVLVRAVLFPLNRRSQTAMARYATKMKRLQPRIEELKKQYANDRAKLQQEQAKLMQAEGAFPPLGGCLPIFLQLPVFFGLFSALRTSFDLRQAPFAGWISDLSRPDHFFYLGWNVPFIDLEWLNLLPILMVVLWIWQQKTMPTPTDEQARRMQRIMIFMPLVMGVFLYSYAAGLSLYMMTQSALGILEQKVIKKIWPLDERELPKKSKPGCAPLARAMEQAQERQKQMQKMQQQRGKVPPRKKK